MTLQPKLSVCDFMGNLELHCRDRLVLRLTAAGQLCYPSCGKMICYLQSDDLIFDFNLASIEKKDDDSIVVKTEDGTPFFRVNKEGYVFSGFKKDLETDNSCGYVTNHIFNIFQK